MTDSGMSVRLPENTDSGLFDLNEARELLKKVRSTKESSVSANVSLNQCLQSQSANENLPEVKDYTLNKLNAVEKLHKLCSKNDFDITKTGGGVVLKLSTGMYQLVKRATHNFFTSESQFLSCALQPSVDKAGTQVQTMYKVSRGKKHL